MWASPRERLSISRGQSNRAKIDWLEKRPLLWSSVQWQGYPIPTSIPLQEYTKTNGRPFATHPSGHSWGVKVDFLDQDHYVLRVLDDNWIRVNRDVWTKDLNGPGCEQEALTKYSQLANRHRICSTPFSTSTNTNYKIIINEDNF
jgi:hypothetical protein